VCVSVILLLAKQDSTISSLQPVKLPMAARTCETPAAAAAAAAGGCQHLYVAGKPQDSPDSGLHPVQLPMAVRTCTQQQQ
jgi:hypothetical protein